MACCSFDDAAGDRPSGLEGLVVVDEGGVALSPPAGAPGASRSPCRRAEHQQRRAGCRSRGAGGIEGGDVHRGRPHELFGLAFAECRRPAAAFDRLHGVVVGPAGGFQHHQPAQPQAMSHAWQIQHLVGRIAVGRARGTQRGAGDDHRPDQGRQLAPVALLQPGAPRGEPGPAAGVQEGGQLGFLPASAQVQVALQEEACQLPRPLFGVFLHPLVGQEQGFGAGGGIDEASEERSGSGSKGSAAAAAADAPVIGLSLVRAWSRLAP